MVKCVRVPFTLRFVGLLAVYEHDSFSAVDAHIFPELVQTILVRVDC